MATFTQQGDRLIEIHYEGVQVKPTLKAPLATKTKQFCCLASDQILRDMIRGMDDRERTIVADELLKIYGKEAN